MCKYCEEGKRGKFKGRTPDFLILQDRFAVKIEKDEPYVGDYGLAVSDNEEHKIFIRNLGLNESLEKDKCFLENELRPYKDLAHLYKCNNSKELHILIRELETKLYYKNHNMIEKK